MQGAAARAAMQGQLVAQQHAVAAMQAQVSAQIASLQQQQQQQQQHTRAPEPAATYAQQPALQRNTSQRSFSSADEDAMDISTSADDAATRGADRRSALATPSSMAVQPPTPGRQDSALTPGSGLAVRRTRRRDSCDSLAVWRATPADAASSEHRFAATEALLAGMTSPVRLGPPGTPYATPPPVPQPPSQQRVQRHRSGATAARPSQLHASGEHEVRASERTPQQSGPGALSSDTPTDSPPAPVDQRAQPVWNDAAFVPYYMIGTEMEPGFDHGARLRRIAAALAAAPRSARKRRPT
jgi:hypothetical protein